jgi:hypothetical protein
LAAIDSRGQKHIPRCNVKEFHTNSDNDMLPHGIMQEPNDEGLLGRLVRALGGVPGIRAIVLGGSRARGEATAT